MVYLLRALVDGVEEVHRQPEAICCKAVQRSGLGVSHANLRIPVPLSLSPGCRVHLLLVVLAANWVGTSSHSLRLAKLVDYT